MTCGDAPAYVWPGGGITVMADMMRMPDNSFGTVPKPAIVAPIDSACRSRPPTLAAGLTAVAAFRATLPDGLQRRPSRDLKDDSDLGRLPVTVQEPPLGADAVRRPACRRPDGCTTPATCGRRRWPARAGWWSRRMRVRRSDPFCRCRQRRRAPPVHCPRRCGLVRYLPNELQDLNCRISQHDRDKTHLHPGGRHPPRLRTAVTDSRPLPRIGGLQAHEIKGTNSLR